MIDRIALWVIGVCLVVHPLFVFAFATGLRTELEEYASVRMARLSEPRGVNQGSPTLATDAILAATRSGAVGFHERREVAAGLIEGRVGAWRVRIRWLHIKP